MSDAKRGRSAEGNAEGKVVSLAIWAQVPNLEAVSANPQATQHQPPHFAVIGKEQAAAEDPRKERGR